MQLAGVITMSEMILLESKSRVTRLTTSPQSGPFEFDPRKRLASKSYLFHSANKGVDVLGGLDVVVLAWAFWFSTAARQSSSASLRATFTLLVCCSSVSLWGGSRWGSSGSGAWLPTSGSEVLVVDSSLAALAGSPVVVKGNGVAGAGTGVEGAGVIGAALDGLGVEGLFDPSGGTRGVWGTLRRIGLACCCGWPWGASAIWGRSCSAGGSPSRSTSM